MLWLGILTIFSESYSLEKNSTGSTSSIIIIFRFKIFMVWRIFANSLCLLKMNAHLKTVQTFLPIYSAYSSSETWKSFSLKWSERVFVMFVLILGISKNENTFWKWKHILKMNAHFKTFLPIYSAYSFSETRKSFSLKFPNCLSNEAKN